MKKYCLYIFAVFGIISCFFLETALAQDLHVVETTLNSQKIDSLVKLLQTPDPKIVRYFPRWRICEPDLQVQVYQTFLLSGKYKEKDLQMEEIEVVAAPKKNSDGSFSLLTIRCGSSIMAGSELETSLLGLSDVISGKKSLAGVKIAAKKATGQAEDNRAYCFSDITPDAPPAASSSRQIIDFMTPNDVKHSITLSFFEQAVKIGETGFWLRSSFGDDNVGYPFWAAGEGKVVLKRPLYKNTDASTAKSIPNLIDAYLGGAYRISSGVDNAGTLFSFVPQRKLNSASGGKLVSGLDFHMPFHPQLGITLNMELPLKEFKDEGISIKDYAYYPVSVDRNVYHTANSYAIDSIAPLLGASGQVALFYNWWLDPAQPENYFRFDVGISYLQVDEAAKYRTSKYETRIARDSIVGLVTYKPSEFSDWIYLKGEYRNQSTWPFGVSLQYSNQILLGRVYIPLVGQWLYLEGKYATPLRDARPYETKNFFMISPVLRLTI